MQIPNIHDTNQYENIANQAGIINNKIKSLTEKLNYIDNKIKAAHSRRQKISLSAEKKEIEDKLSHLQISLIKLNPGSSATDTPAQFSPKVMEELARVIFSHQKKKVASESEAKQKAEEKPKTEEKPKSEVSSNSSFISRVTNGLYEMMFGHHSKLFWGTVIVAGSIGTYILLKRGGFLSRAAPPAPPAQPDPNDLMKQYWAVKGKLIKYLKDHSLAWCTNHGPKISKALYDFILEKGKLEKYRKKDFEVLPNSPDIWKKPK